MPKPAAKTSYVSKLTADQARELREILEPGEWALDTCPYAHWRAKLDGTTIVAYESGKLVVQGKGTAEFVQFTLEPKILKEARFGYEDVLAEAENPAMFTPHAGIDESGKGDYFGPLVIAAVHLDGQAARDLLELGVADSKTIKGDTRIGKLAAEIRRRLPHQYSIVPIGPEAYNRLYAKIRNVNRLLAWGHARALENVLDLVPDCPRAISDQFGRAETVRRALMEKGRDIVLEQRPKAESDIAVAAASILARDEFVRRLDTLGKNIGMTLPKGASQAVIAAGRKVVADHGRDALGRLAKLHFKTTASL